MAVTVWLLPIEPFDERYSADWLRWWPSDLQAAGLDVELVMGTRGAGERTGGEWLDPTRTWEWKGTQVAALAAVWHRVKDDDVVVSLDGWGPAITAALYMKHTTGKRVGVAGFFHAGCFDPHDFLPRAGCAPWGLHIEKGWAVGCDLMLVGSEAAAQLIRSHLTAAARVEVTGYPIKAAELQQYATPWADRPPLVVFPHRLAPEKGVDEWDELQRRFAARWPDCPVEWVRSRDVYTDKASLYRLLGRARVSVSCARQETFGIVMQESVALGAHPLWPHRLSYPEVMRGAGSSYSTIPEAVDLLHGLLHRQEPAEWDGHHELAVARAAAALGRI